MHIYKRVNRKDQGMPQSQAAANPLHQQEEKKGQNLTPAKQINKCTIST